MSWDKGFNFRATSGFVVDGANETYVLGDAYPTTRNTVTFGWGTALPTADRAGGIDRRLAGINYNNATTTFQIDLPSTGTYVIHMAAGDQGGGGTNSSNIEFKDGSTSLFNVTFDPPSANFWDATGASYNYLNWPGSEVGVSKVFATTTLNVVMTSPGYWTLAHIFVSQQTTVVVDGLEWRSPKAVHARGYDPMIIRG